MTVLNQDDFFYMTLAIREAEKGRYTTSPNPNVGCVIVKDNQVIGKGFHIQAGGPHAEVHALVAAGENAQGATAYVTLEPCSHTGKTPPCAEALIKAQVAKVVVGMTDPNPQVSGRGIEKLRNAGIQVHQDCLTQECEKLNAGFIKRMVNKLPYVQLKLGSSLDGRTAMSSGESQWITSAKARQDVQDYRAQACAVITGVGTVMADNPSLNVRQAEFKPNHYPCEKLRQPVKVVIDNQHQITPEYKLINQAETVYLVSNKHRNDAENINWPVNVKFLTLSQAGEHVCLTELLTQLALLEINQVWVEAGAKLAGAFIAQGLVDELIIYQAPKLLGENTKGLIEVTDLTKLNQAIEWRYQEVRQVGDDLKLVLFPKLSS
ncbi:bifunctional diaminohydroxyphosphoribosylaminopyrimidine deaminase/5-amino-6-(5-phosphoribosylamino)uracil reductase RibD [Catenovulum maritimum]|uniref:Riboflavin biosynthesis protein RibD n=1 Tax=Catenovulum maritimum TaxID=1513271 RepID=A0A0J8JKX8_9ALTE|nr:bifunctional diaminohydroxyphosphoribosylaminopyrimidine deaminase/5-amino-6-(5-phosphoribosylamino)uracil reductase RibD [Catenovulum maritimum]KMT65191.1 5-amino-6-(5-phosphoribosylamino)uracil reductase [Catenovulum maritimum]